MQNFMVSSPHKCVGHVEKRLGTRLRKLRNKNKYEILADRKKCQEKED